MNIIWLVNRENSEAPPQLHPLPAMWQLPRHDGYFSPHGA